MSAIRTTLTPMDEPEIRYVSFKELEILPDTLQTRDGTNVAKARKYSVLMTGGAAFPPALVFLTPEGRFLLADGFHRAAARKSLGFRNIQARIVLGTHEDAILAGIKENMEQAENIVVTEDDRNHAAKIMIRNETFRGWSDKEIGRRCGRSPAKVKGLRLALRDSEGIPLPDRTTAFSGGRPTGHSHRYEPYKGDPETIPAICRTQDGLLRADWIGKKLNLGTDPMVAKQTMESMASTREQTRAYLKDNHVFKQWLIRRSILTVARNSVIGGCFVSGVTVFAVADASWESILTAIGRAFLARKENGASTRVVIVGYLGNSTNAGKVIALASQPPDPIEFMTPEKFVAEFGPKDDASPADPTNEPEGI